MRSGLFIFPKELSAVLKCTYSDHEYLAEIDRLKNIKCEISTQNGTEVNHVEYSDTKFNYPAYITAYGGNRIFE